MTEFRKKLLHGFACSLAVGLALHATTITRLVTRAIAPPPPEPPSRFKKLLRDLTGEEHDGRGPLRALTAEESARRQERIREHLERRKGGK